jgi:signal transduction histidine kinase
MNNIPPKEQDSTEYTPEERTLLFQLRVSVTMRWLAVPAIIITTLVASQVFNIGFSTIPVYVICGIIAVCNMCLIRQTQRLKTEKAGARVRKAETYGNIIIIIDMATLTVLMHYTGGIENPFLFLYLIHTAGAGIVVPKRRAYELSTLAIGMFALLIFLEYANIIPHVNLQRFALPGRYEQLSRVLGVLAALATSIYATTYLTTSVSGELRRRQREVVKLRDQLLEKKTTELEQTSKEVAKLDEERRRFVRFLGIVAHDLQSPLVATQSLMSYILEGYTGQITDGQKDLLERGTRRIDGLLTLITDLLDVPRIESGQIAQEMKEISLNETVKRSTEGLDNLARKKGITLKVELSPSSPKVHASHRRLQQVITNLTNNAINYTREGMVLVRVVDGDNDARVEIMDTGIGVPPQDLPRLFDDFFRGSNVETKGTGLGLSISKRIIEAHGGKIWAESPCPETNKGTKFTFTLPKKHAVAVPEKREQLK